MMRVRGRQWRGLAIRGAAAATLAFAPIAPAAQEASVFGGLQSSGGRFIFDVPTVTHTVTIGAAYATRRFGVDALLPIVIQNSGAVTFIGGQPVPTGGPRSGTLGGRQRGERIPLRRGGGAITGAAAVLDSTGLAEEPGPYRTLLGDPMASLRATVVDGVRQRLDVTAGVKLPLADPDDGIGTGKVDAGVGADYSVTAGRMLLLLGVSHWMLGDLPELPLRNVTGATAAAMRALGTGGRWTGMLHLYAATSVADGLEPPASVGLGLGRQLRGGRSISLSFGVGLTDASPDWSLGLGWRLSEDRLSAVR